MSKSKTYVISKATHQLFVSLTRPGADFVDNSSPAPGGNVAILLQADVSERLESKRFPGETDDALLDRVLRTAEHGVN
jgi:hypothetical protein